MFKLSAVTAKCLCVNAYIYVFFVYIPIDFILLFATNIERKVGKTFSKFCTYVFSVQYNKGTLR